MRSTPRRQSTGSSFCFSSSADSHENEPPAAEGDVAGGGQEAADGPPQVLEQDELLLKIFEGLSLAQLATAQQVCRRWRRVANDRTLYEGLLCGEPSNVRAAVTGRRQRLVTQGLHAAQAADQVPAREAMMAWRRYEAHLRELGESGNPLCIGLRHDATPGVHVAQISPCTTRLAMAKDLVAEVQTTGASEGADVGLLKAHHQSQVSSISLSPDSKLLATTSVAPGEGVLLWHLAGDACGKQAGCIPSTLGGDPRDASFVSRARGPGYVLAVSGMQMTTGTWHIVPDDEGTHLNIVRLIATSGLIGALTAFGINEGGGSILSPCGSYAKHRQREASKPYPALSRITNDGTAVAWSARLGESGKPAYEGIEFIAVSADETRLATASRSNGVMLWALPGHGQAPVDAIAHLRVLQTVHPNGTLLGGGLGYTVMAQPSFSTSGRFVAAAMRHDVFGRRRSRAPKKHHHNAWVWDAESGAVAVHLHEYGHGVRDCYRWRANFHPAGSGLVLSAQFGGSNAVLFYGQRELEEAERVEQAAAAGAAKKARKKVCVVQ